MTNHRWYFLIQKEGETQWHSLTASGTLSEGRYRLAAKSDRPHLDLAIRLTNLAIASEKRDSNSVIQNYQGRVNSQGFVLLSPVIYFSPGNWQLYCQPIPSETLPDNQWQITLNFEMTASEKVEAIASNTEEIPSHQSLLEIKLPEVFTIPEFSLTPHKFISLDDKSLTPELENISHNHYPIDTFTTPKLISAETNSSEKAPVFITEKANLTVVDELTTEGHFSQINPIDLKATMAKEVDQIPFDLNPTLVEEAEETDKILSLSPPETVNSTITESAINYKKETTYIIQLQDLLTHTSVTVDIAILEEEDHVPLNIKLPDPKLKYKLHYTSQSFPPVLPPKLSFSKNKREQRLRFTKFEPNPQAS